jgi:hypothetical protein
MGRSWFDVVPLSTDIENSTSLDWVLQRSDTDRAVPWRVLLRYQTVAERNALETRIGTLTAVGRSTLEEVLAGRGSNEQFGSPIDGPYDSRLTASDDIGLVTQLVGQAYARLHQSDQVQERTTVIAFPMRRIVASASASNGLALAAASDSGEEGFFWSVEIPGRGHLQGRIERSLDDQLLFVVEEVTEDSLGLRVPLRLAFTSEVLEITATSPPFLASAGEAVLLGRDYGVFPSEVDELELRLVNEG